MVAPRVSQEPPVLPYTRSCRRWLPVLAAAFLAPIPAFAAEATRLPEPSGLFLLAMGVAGVVIGRRFSRNRPD